MTVSYRILLSVYCRCFYLSHINKILLTKLVCLPSFITLISLVWKTTGVTFGLISK